MTYKLGKLPARPGAVKLEFAKYSTLPTPPSKSGHWQLVQIWNMLGNDQYGDCVWAGAAHETMLWNREADKTVNFTDQEVLSDYSKVTGFNPNDPNSDQGTDMQVAASYRKKTGITDGKTRHKIGAYVAITPGNSTELKQAIWLFGAVGIGIQFPDYAMDEFIAGQSWHVKSGGSITGGHYIPAVGYDGRYIYVVTWGKIQKMSWGFMRKYMDEGIAYISSEFLTNGKSLDGFDLATLTQDLAQLT